ncbi:MAG TPA: TIGR02206 family membrane protein, partial [Cryomorphaceae bacterium]|nr:TIGR02206 family membrane protein [Cryomorphaceae bacterium]
MGSSGWWSGIGIFATYGLLVVAAARFLKGDQALRRFEMAWGLALVALWIGKHIHLVNEGLWNVMDNLELHLCGFSRFLSVFLLLFGWRWAYYPLFFWGIVGGFHSLLTPELTSGDTPYMFVEYYVVHGGIIIIPLYYHFVRGMRIGRWTWAKVLGINLSLMLPIGLANYLTGGNYMFLCSPPKVDNP